MKRSIFTVSIVLLSIEFLFGQENRRAAKCQHDVEINPKYPKAKAIQEIMDRYTVKDLPGVAVAVYSEKNGWWTSASGYSKVETKTRMTDCHLQYLQSVSKSYMATAIMMLREEGRIRLEAPITEYLSKRVSGYVKNAKKITVRMLLNHTSGVADYSIDPEFTEMVVMHPEKVSKMEDALKVIANEEAQYAPGAKYQYTNTNYTLLALIADKITGDHAKYISEKIFRKLGLYDTYYRSDRGYLKYDNLPNTYWDILNTGRPANITPLQVANVSTMIGDDGIVSTPIDAIRYFKGLMEGKLVKDSSLALMQQWVKNEAGRQVYGMGMFRFEEAGLVGFGHGGGGIGAGCFLLYVPERKTYLFLATNIGVLWEGLPAKKAEEMKGELLGAILF